MEKRKIPKSDKMLNDLVRDVMMNIQDDYSLGYPATAKIVAELKRRNYTITKSDNKRIIAERADVKYDIEHPTGYGFTI